MASDVLGLAPPPGEGKETPFEAKEGDETIWGKGTLR